jgi:hypothetical protein
MRKSALLISGLGITGSLVMSLPMPWRVRMGIASILGRVMGWGLTRKASIYTYVIDRNQRFGMGKQSHGEMQSIHALNRVVKEMDKRHIDPERVKLAMKDAEAAGISSVELPRFQILGSEETQRLLCKLPGY